MFIGSDVGSTHDHRHRHHHNLGKDHSTAATTTVTKVSRDSHLIKKSSSLTSPPLTPTSKTHTRQPQPPLIIYAHAPRVIHAKVQEFKALVQTLTGYTGNKNSTIKTTTTKNDLPSPPPHPPTSLIPPPSKVPMYYDFEEFETKNVIPLTNNNLFSIHDDHKHNTSMMDCLGGDIGYNFAAPIFETPLVHQTNSASLPYFTPTYGDQFCCTNNNFNTANSNTSSSVGFVGKINNNNNNNNNQMFHNHNYVAAETGSGSGSGCYYSDGLSSSLDLSSSLSSVEEAIDELTDFS